MEMMQQTSEVLRRRGFTAEEIERLTALRMAWRERQKQQATAITRRLEFVRWMVATGRITEEVVE